MSGWTAGSGGALVSGSAGLVGSTISAVVDSTAAGAEGCGDDRGLGCSAVGQPDKASEINVTVKHPSTRCHRESWLMTLTFRGDFGKPASSSDCRITGKASIVQVPGYSLLRIATRE